MNYYLLILALIVFQACEKVNTNSSDITPLNLRTEYKVNPVLDILNPRLSWELESEERGQVQTAYEILVASSPELLSAEKADLWKSGKVESNASNQIEYRGKSLNSKIHCFWKVRSWDKNGNPGVWSETASWEMGLLSKDEWQAKWIGNDLTHLGKGKVYHLPPAPFFRKEAVLKSKVKKARLYVSSLGLYEFQINGEKIGEDYFTPGWTDYNKRVYYQTYDISSDLKEGENAFGAILGEGWYAGYLAYALLVRNPIVKNFYGDVPLLKAQIEIEYENGEKEIIVSDETWKTNHGPILEADILNGETYDANLEFGNWSEAGFDDTNWMASQVYPEKAGREIECYPGNPVQVFSELKPVSVKAREGGKYIFDLGQNFAGIVRLKVKGQKGDKITLKFGEALFPDGSLMTENLRMARVTDTYILKGDPEGETWTPRFTYHGFQYVEVEGFKYTPTAVAITGLALTSTTPVIGALETSSEMVNQLYHNIVWTQRNNYFDVPTDCPQRDERLGWTGDAQAYILSATFNSDISAFFTKWMVDLNDAILENDAYPIYAPAPKVRATDTYSPGWSEAGVICPYTIFKTYGDTRMIKEFWPQMLAYLKFMEEKTAENYIYKERSFEDLTPKGGYGDWLSVGAKTPPDLLASIYFAYCAQLMKEMAVAINETDDAGYFADLFEKSKNAFEAYYTDGNGRIRTNAEAYGDGAGYVLEGQTKFSGHSQTAYANAIYMGLLSDENKAIAGQHLADLIAEDGGKLSTGFLGLKPLLPALSETGHSDVAYQLLLNNEYPSWGFEVMNGANTIWERWNSYIKGVGFTNNAGMNSFNHYAFGAVNEWMFGNMAGIKVGEPGYRTFTIRPEIAKDGIDFVNASYHSINGEIGSSWKKDGDKLVFEVKIPVNTKATVTIPANENNTVLLDGEAINECELLEILERAENDLTVMLGSGKYKFEINKN
ncbi:alpha-L-rhamnosidase [Draconibacterium sediminis]|uniref:alpha-L-rhamnosidase n=1 Tax=Draconibacterium sediminis TaxID=1544798 RepID=UPI0012F7314C|nr:alpha-L-rhamnosidase [Draconibacterium sediminis]